MSETRRLFVVVMVAIFEHALTGKGRTRQRSFVFHFLYAVQSSITSPRYRGWVLIWQIALAKAKSAARFGMQAEPFSCWS